MVFPLPTLPKELSYYVDFKVLFLNFSLFPALRAAPSSMVLVCVFAKWWAVLFYTKSYHPLVGGTSPIPLNKLNAWLRNSYELLYFAVGYFFRNEKRGEPISLILTDSPLELSSDIVFSDTFLLLLFITFKELVDIVFCSLNLLHIFLNLTIFTVQLFLFCKDLGILCTDIFYLRKLLKFIFCITIT